MTFQIGQDDVVFQKDPGAATAGLAPTITKFNPDLTRARTEVTDQ